MIGTWGLWLLAVATVFVGWVVLFWGVVNLKPEEFQEMQKKHPGPLIDVREPHEFRSGHLPGAHNIPLGQVDQITKKWDKEEPLYLYCRSGSRSGIAARQLKKAGYKQVYSLRGGIRAWYPLSS